MQQGIPPFFSFPYLTQGDKKDFAKLRIKGNYSFKITTPSEFLEMILPEILKALGSD